MSLDKLSEFLFLYPLVLAFIWMVGSLIFRFAIGEKPFQPFEKGKVPPISILVPCHNEEECLEETILKLMNLNLETYEAILINDCSTDNTLGIMIECQQKFPQANIRIMNLTSNQGKGAGMTMAASVSRYEYILGIDADSVLDSMAPQYLMWHLENDPNVGCVTGNPKVRNRISALAKVQVGEFASIIGMIKRTQQLLGVLYTVSGVVACFRKKAVLEAGMWSNDMVTEDIDITWKIQLNGWDAKFEPRALCWILVPETLKGIFNQRLRWSQGGNEVLLKYWHCLLSWKQRRMWLLYLEYCMAIVWCYLFTFFLVYSLLTGNLSFFFEPNIVCFLSFVCISQFALGLALDSGYDKTLYKNIPWLVIYPLAYWVVNTSVTVLSFPKALFKKKGTAATWTSPDRGQRND